MQRKEKELKNLSVREKVIQSAVNYAAECFSDDYSGHDYWHTIRVYKLATKLAEKENADLFLVQLAALLHDTDDRKLSPDTWINKENAVSFMKKHGINTFDVSKLETPLAVTKEESSAIKNFWAANEWARKAFSKNMTYAWKKVKEEQSVVYQIRVAPKGFIAKMLGWAKQNGIELGEEDFIGRFDPNNQKNNYINREISKYTRKYVDCIGSQSTIMANSFFLALLNINREISKMDLSKVDNETKNLCKLIQKTIKASLFEDMDLPFEKNQFKVLDANEVQAVYGTLRNRCLEVFNPKMANMFEKHMDKAYDYVSKNYKTSMPIRMNPYGMDI